MPPRYWLSLNRTIAGFELRTPEVTSPGIEGPSRFWCSLLRREGFTALAPSGRADEWGAAGLLRQRFVVPAERWRSMLPGDFHERGVGRSGSGRPILNLLGMGGYSMRNRKTSN